MATVPLPSWSRATLLQFVPPAQKGLLTVAEYPCDVHLARYTGPSTRCFLNLYRDEQVVSLRASVCQGCLALLLQEWLPRAMVKNDQGYWDPLEGDQELETLWRAQERPLGRRNGR